MILLVVGGDLSLVLSFVGEVVLYWMVLRVFRVGVVEGDGGRGGLLFFVFTTQLLSRMNCRSSSEKYKCSVWLVVVLVLLRSIDVLMVVILVLLTSADALLWLLWLL